MYTTRCDTLFGATYMVVSPEHAMVEGMAGQGHPQECRCRQGLSGRGSRKSDFERSELNKEKTGVKLEGVMGINPGQRYRDPHFHLRLRSVPTAPVPSWLCPPDTRDWEFAKKFGLPIIEVVKGNTPSNLDEAAFTDVATGTLVNSGFLNGLSVTDAKKKMIDWLEANGKGCDKVNYKLRDWVFSRQRYWGEPSPWSSVKSAAGSPCPRAACP
ncbi:MAG: hypothetical protein ACLTNY_00215 [Blautia massiliensis (ex Durand et al. 2017)]